MHNSTAKRLYYILSFLYFLPQILHVINLTPYILLQAFEETRCGDFKAVRVQVCGVAFYTGKCSFTFEEDDPLRDGFLVK